MSLAVKATRGAAWMFAGGLVSRIVGLIATFVVIRFVSPDDYGEAIAASIVVQTASQFSSLGIGQFVIVKAGGHRDLAFHATVYQLGLGLLAIGLLVAIPGAMSSWFNAPGLGRYIPALGLSMALDRISFVPERVLMRDLSFRRVAFSRSAGEMAYAGASAVLAMMGWGGMAIAIANVVRSVIKVLVMVPAVDRRDWLEPCRLRWDATLEVIRYGGPLSVGGIAGFIAGKWDNLLVSRFFGPGVMGAYNLAYNLAGMAPGVVTEQVIDVLVPSFKQADPEARPKALLRGISLLSLTTTPLCFGLAAVSSTVAWTFLAKQWSGVAPMLAILSVVTVVAPLLGLALGYLQVNDQPRKVMLLQVVAAIGILGCIAAFGRLGPLVTCAAVGAGALLCYIVGLIMIAREEKGALTIGQLIGTQAGTVLACIPLVGAVLALQKAEAAIGFHVRYVSLLIEIVAGGVGYFVGVAIFARPILRDMLGLFQRAFLRRRTAKTAAPAVAGGGS